MNKLFYIFYFIALSNGFPTETIISTVQNNDSTPSRLVTIGLPVKRQYPKSRIVSNVYRSSPAFMSPINPMENLLLYLLLSAGRDFAEDEIEVQKEHDKRRSPDIFSDAIGDIVTATGHLVNGTKNAFGKIEDTFRGSRETSYESEHNPHPLAQEGTCMCFNRIFRARSTHHFEPVIRARISSGTTDHKPKLIGSLTEAKRTTQSVGYKNLTVSEDPVTQQHVLDDSLLKNTENITKGAATVRVVRVADLIGEEVGTSLPTTGGVNKIHDLEDDIMLELQNEDGTSKRNTIDSGGPPPWLESIKSAEKALSNKQKATLPNEIVQRKMNDSDKIDDDGYYFLFYSGGTDKRTTAKNVKREPQKRHNLNDNHFDIIKDFPGFLHRRKLHNRRSMRKLQASIDLTTNNEISKNISFSPINITAEMVNGIRTIGIQEENGEEVKSHDRVQREKPSGKKTDEKKSNEKKTDQKKTDEKKLDEKKTDEKKLDEKKSDEKKTDEKKTEEKKSNEKKSDEKKTVEKKTDEKKNRTGGGNMTKPEISLRANETIDDNTTTTEIPTGNVTGNATGNGTDGDEGNETDYGGPEGGEDETKGKGSSKYLYSVTIPTAACLLLLIIALCFLVKPTGRCCDRFLRNPGQPSRRQRIARARAQMKADSKANYSQRSQPKLNEEIEVERPRRVTLQENPIPYSKQHGIKETIAAFTRIDRRRGGNSSQNEIENQIKKDRKKRDKKVKMEKKEKRDEGDKNEGEEEIKEKVKRAVPSGDTSYEIMSIQ